MIKEFCLDYNVIPIKNTSWGKIWHPEVVIEENVISTSIISKDEVIRITKHDLLWVFTDIPYYYDDLKKTNKYNQYQDEELNALVVSLLYNASCKKVNAFQLNDPFRYLNGVHRLAALNSVLEIPFRLISYHTKEAEGFIGWENMQYGVDESSFFVDKSLLKNNRVGYVVFFRGEAIQYNINTECCNQIDLNLELIEKIERISKTYRKDYLEILFLIDKEELLQISDVPFLLATKIGSNESLKNFLKKNW